MLGWLTHELKTVRAVRGTAQRALTKLESAGWELVSKEVGAVYTTLKVRRVRTGQSRLRIVGGLAAAFALVAVVGVGAALESDDASRESSQETTAASAEDNAESEKAQATSMGPSVASSLHRPMVWGIWEIVDDKISVDSDLYGAFDPQFWVRNTGSHPADGYFTVTFLKDGKTLGYASCTTNLTLASGEEVQPGSEAPTRCDSDDRFVRSWTEVTITSGEWYDY